MNDTSFLSRAVSRSSIFLMLSYAIFFGGLVNFFCYILICPGWFFNCSSNTFLLWLATIVHTKRINVRIPTISPQRPYCSKHSVNVTMMPITTDQSNVLYMFLTLSLDILRLFHCSSNGSKRELFMVFYFNDDDLLTSSIIYIIYVFSSPWLFYVLKDFCLEFLATIPISKAYLPL